MTSQVISSTGSGAITLLMVQWLDPDKPSLHRCATLSRLASLRLNETKAMSVVTSPRLFSQAMFSTPKSQSQVTADFLKSLDNIRQT